MVDESPKYEPFQMYFAATSDGLVHGRQYLRIIFRTLQVTILWPAGEKGNEDLMAFASSFERIIQAARSEMYVRDSMRDLDIEITKFLTPEDEE